MADSQLTKRCPQCEEIKPLSDFFKSKTTKSKFSCWCRACGSKKSKEYQLKHPNRHKQYIKRWSLANRDKINADRQKWRKQNYQLALKIEREKAKVRKEKFPNYARSWRLKKMYGMSLDEYQRLLFLQGGRCAICGTDKPGSRFKNLLVDHCHKEGKIRGLVCNSCNILLGNCHDDPEILLQAIAYLREWEKTESEFTFNFSSRKK